jgi:hypothetical protein
MIFPEKVPSNAADGVEPYCPYIGHSTRIASPAQHIVTCIDRLLQACCEMQRRIYRFANH